MFKDEPKKLFDYDDKSGHVIEKGSLRPDGTRRKDRMVKIAAAVEQRFPDFFPTPKYIPPHLRDDNFEEMQKSMNDLKITIVNDNYQRKEKLLSYLNSEIGDYKCTCNRPENVLVCANCDFSAMGRILTICRTHPLDFKSTDLNYCPECNSHQLYMVEHPSKEAIEKAKAKRQPKAELDYVKVELKAPLRRPFEEKPEESKSIFKDSICKKEINPKEEKIVNPKKRVSFAEDETNNCKDENDQIEPITITFATKAEKIHQQDLEAWKTWGNESISTLEKINEKLAKMHKERDERMQKVENFMKTIKISPEIDAKVESWFAGETWCIPVEYVDEVVIENPYKPRNFNMETCICNRGLSFVVCGFCGFDEIDARTKLACTLHPKTTKGSDISLCPGCQYPGFLTELVYQEKA